MPEDFQQMTDSIADKIIASISFTVEALKNAPAQISNTLAKFSTSNIVREFAKFSPEERQSVLTTCNPDNIGFFQRIFDKVDQLPKEEKWPLNQETENSIGMNDHDSDVGDVDDIDLDL